MVIGECMPSCTIYVHRWRHRKYFSFLRKQPNLNICCLHMLFFYIVEIKTQYLAHQFCMVLGVCTTSFRIFSLQMAPQEIIYFAARTSLLVHTLSFHTYLIVFNCT